jgi:hypothetical protein
MPKGGVLTIRTERKIVDAPAPVHGDGGSSYCRIGEGHWHGDRQREYGANFESFFHQQGCRRSHQIGALRRVGIITQTGGPITVESVGMGQGVVFTIYLARLGRRISRNTMNPNPRWRVM